MIGRGLDAWDFVMANFTPLSAAIGGALIGLSAVLLMLLTGRIAGISGIFSGLLNLRSEDKGWRIAFLAGLILAPVHRRRDRLRHGAAESCRRTGPSLSLRDCWSVSARGSAAAAPPVTAFAG